MLGGVAVSLSKEQEFDLYHFLCSVVIMVLVLSRSRIYLAIMEVFLLIPVYVLDPPYRLLLASVLES